MNWILHIGSCRWTSSGRGPNQLALQIRTTFCQAISLQLSLSAKNYPIPSTNCPHTLITFREHTSFSSGVLLEQLWIFARFSVNFCPILRGYIRTAVHTMQLPISHNNALFYARVIALDVFPHCACQGIIACAWEILFECALEGLIACPWVRWNECTSVVIFKCASVGTIECASMGFIEGRLVGRTKFSILGAHSVPTSSRSSYQSSPNSRRLYLIDAHYATPHLSLYAVSMLV